MKKKYIGGIAAILVVALIAIGVVILNGKYTLHVSTDIGYTVQVKDVQIDAAGEASVKKGKQIVFAVSLDKDYSDSDIKVKANDEMLTAQKGVYRYTVDSDTSIQVEGVAKNDHVVSGIDVEPGTMDGQEFTMLRDKEGRPVPVLADLNLNTVDTYDVPDLNLTASVAESINPGGRYRTLSELNLGKYKGVKFFVKHSNYFQAKLNGAEDFYVGTASENWDEFFFKYEDGAVNLYINGNLSANCNYLSDIQVCLQEVGSYKFSNIYVIERKDYKGANVTVTEGDGYYLDLLPREYAVNAKLTFHVTIDDSFKKGPNFAVKAGGKVLKANSDGSYTFTLKKDTLVSVSGVVGKPLDSRYKVVEMPFYVDAKETTNYLLMQGIKNGKTYTYTQKTWGYLTLPEINLEKYNSLLFFIKKDDTDENSWISMVQKADDGTQTEFLQTNNNQWHRIEFKKEGGKIYFYADGKKYDTPVIDAEHFMCALNDNGKVRFTSMIGIVDKNYKEPAPDYVSSKYKAIDTPILVDAKTIANYELVKKVKGAKTYQFTPPQWCSLAMNFQVNFDKYTDLKFFVRKADKGSDHWIVFSKVDSKGSQLKDFIASNNSRWYEIDLKKVKNGKFYVYVNGVKQDATISKADDLRLIFNENSDMQFTSLMGIVDKSYKEPEPDYLSSKYETIGSPIAIMAKEVETYPVIRKIPGAKTYQCNPLTWVKVGFNDYDLNKYEKTVFFICKEDRNTANWIVLQKENDKGAAVADGAYILSNGNKWYKVEFKKVKDGKFDVYVNGEKQKTSISKLDELKFSFNEKSKITFTSFLGIRDKNYKEPEPDYISSAYKGVVGALAVEGSETANYNRLDKVSGAKTYVFTTTQWGEIGFNEMELARYKDVIFFLHKEDMNTSNWLEFYKKDKKGNRTDFITNNDNKWYQIELKKRSTGNAFDVYVNGEKKNGTVSGIGELRVTLNGNSTLKYTSLCGILDPNYQEESIDYLPAEYQTVASAAVAGTNASEINNYAPVSRVDGAKTYEFTTEWSQYAFTDVEAEKYKSLVFFIRKADSDTGRWLEFYQVDASGGHVSDYIQTNGKDWYKVELKKNTSTGKFDVYIDDTKKGEPVADVAKLKFTLNGTPQYTSLFGILDPDYTDPDTPDEPEIEVRGTMVAMAPWAYGKGTMQHADTAKDLGYAYATIVEGSNTTYGGATMMDVDLSEYESFRFALKSTNQSWWEIGKVAENSYSMLTGASATWVEYEFKKETEDAFVLYKDGEKQAITIPADSNLSDLQMKFGTSGALYMTEVRGVAKEGVVSKVKVVADNFNAYTGTFTAEERPIASATGATVVTTTWTADKAAMIDLELEKYDKVLFYARRVDGSGWFESDYFGSDQLGNNWVEFKLIQVEDGKWNLFRGGKLISEKIALTNLSDVKAAYGSVTYAFSQVFAVEADGAGETEDTEKVIVATPWGYGGGYMDKTVTYTDKGYAYATVIAGNGNTYNGATMNDADLSIYSTVRFALKSDGSAWYEIGKVADNSYSTVANASADWSEIKLVDEGNGYFQMYVNDAWVNHRFPLDMNLSALQMKYGTSGQLILTEVRGELRRDAQPSVTVIRESAYETAGTEVDVELPVAEAGKVTKVSTSWAWKKLYDFKMSPYNMVKFYIRNVADGAAYTELKVGATEAYVAIEVHKNWMEILLSKDAAGKWTVFVGGKKQVEGVTLANLQDIQINYGTNTYYISELFGCVDENYVEDDSSEKILATSAWAPEGATADDTKTYSEKGYSKATVISGSNTTYTGKKLADADLSLYQSVRFALKSDGTAWYEIGKVADNNFSAIAKNSASWVEIVLKDEGNGYFQAYVNDAWINFQLPLNANLSDLQMKFATSGQLIVTEVIGTKR